MKFFYLVLLAAMLSASPLGGEILVRGSLAEGGKSVAGASVSLLPALERNEIFEGYFADFPAKELSRARSDRDGNFELTAPATGFYRLVVDADGYLGVVQSLSLLSPAPQNLQPTRLVPARRARLEVRDPAGQPVAGARVRLGFDSEGIANYPVWPEMQLTAADGGVVLSLPVGQEAAAFVAAPGFVVKQVPLPVGESVARVALESGSPLEVQVFDSRKRALADVGVYVPEVHLMLGRTGRDGKARVSLLPEHRKLAFIDAAGRRGSQDLPPAVAAADAIDPAQRPAPATLRAELAEPQILTGQVLEIPSRTPIADAWVYVHGRPMLFTRSDRNGRFELVAPSGPRKFLFAAKEGYRSTEVQLSESSPEWNLGLEPAARIEGRVTDSAGRGAAGILVRVEATPGPFFDRGETPTVLTDRQGRYLIEEVPVGRELEVATMASPAGSVNPRGAALGPKVKAGPLQAGERATVDLVLHRQEQWSCLVVDKAGNAITGAEVFALEVQPQGRRLSLGELAYWERLSGIYRLGPSDPQGRIETRVLSAGIYDLGARAKGFGSILRRGVQVGPAGGETTTDSGQVEKLVMGKTVPARGRVVDDRGSGVEGATLHLSLIGDEPFVRHRSGRGSPPVATSDASGEFTFTEVEPSQLFELTALKKGYLPGILEAVSLATNDHLILTLKVGGKLEGKVSSGGQPLQGVGLRAEPVDLGPGMDMSRLSRLFGLSDGEGRFQIDAIDPGRYRLEAQSALGHAEWQSEIFELGSGQTKTIDVELRRAAMVVGKVLLPSGEPVGEAWVHLHRSSEESQRFGGVAASISDALGQYRIESAGPGPTWLRVEKAGYRPSIREVELAEGKNEIDLTLDAGELEIGARVVGPDDEPISGAVVSIQMPAASRQGTTAADGSIHFANLDAGTYDLAIRKAGYAFERRPLEVQDSQQSVVWRLAAARVRVHGPVLGLDLAVLPDLQIRVLDKTLQEVEGRAGGGRFEVENLTSGALQLLAGVPSAGMLLVVPLEVSEGQQELEKVLDFSSLSGPWVGRFLLRGQPLRGFRYYLRSPTGLMLLAGGRADGRLELRAAPGSYDLLVLRQFGEQPVPIAIEIGEPREQTIELAPP
jgi:hypothetical protein